MKKDFLLDMLCYISEVKKLEHIVILLIVTGIFYSFFTFKNQHRLNIICNISKKTSKKLINKNIKVLESKKDNVIYLNKCKKSNK